MKANLVVFAGGFGAVLSYMYGEITPIFTTLLWCMVVDYVSGLLLAGVFHKSPNTSNGKIESKACLKGLIRKTMCLLLVLVGARLDILLDAHYVKDGLCVAFIIYECTSITENLALMGVPIPTVIKKALELLEESGENNGVR